MKVFEKYSWEEEKTVSKDGLRYLVRLQDYVLKNPQGKEEAVMFSFSYLRIPQDSSRPVMFAYNGGPGAASSWVHMGLLGPKQISFPNYPNLTQPVKYQIQENEEFLLDQCDLVLMDPVEPPGPDCWMNRRLPVTIPQAGMPETFRNLSKTG